MSTETSNDGVQLTLLLPEELLAALAERVAALVREHAEQGEPGSPWLGFEQARAYLGLSRDQLYKLTAAHAIPVRKKRGGQGLRFRRDELDAWLEAEYPPTGWTR
jgi:excisionase family DNA binding protein